MFRCPKCDSNRGIKVNFWEYFESTKLIEGNTVIDLCSTRTSEGVHFDGIAKCLSCGHSDYAMLFAGMRLETPLLDQLDIFTEIISSETESTDAKDLLILLRKARRKLHDYLSKKAVRDLKRSRLFPLYDQSTNTFSDISTGKPLDLGESYQGPIITTCPETKSILIKYMCYRGSERIITDCPPD